jgi:ketosteroid isomerase-like protein
MSQENIEAFERGLQAYNQQDIEVLLDVLDPEVEWRPAVQKMLGGEATVYRGHEGIREMLRDLSETLNEINVEFSEVRDQGDQVVAIGRLRTRGRASGVVTEAPLGYVADFRNGIAIRIRTYVDPKEALEAAGLSE